MRKAINNREAPAASTSDGGKRVTAVKSGRQIFTELARKNPEFFEILGTKKDCRRRMEAFMSQGHLQDYGRDLEKLRRVDSRISGLKSAIGRLQGLHEKVKWMNCRSLEMDYESAVRSRERVLEQSRRKVEAIRRSGIVMIDKIEEFRMFQKLRREVGLDGVRVAVSPE